MDLSYERVCSLEELRSAPNRRKVVRLASGRAVLIFLHERDGSVSAIDEFCYHHGGPLSDGDIEELPGGRCVVLCPWHHYKIDVHTGDCLYQGIDIATGTTAWKSKGVKQRPHLVDLHSDGSVWVADSSKIPQHPPSPPPPQREEEGGFAFSDDNFEAGGFAEESTEQSNSSAAAKPKPPPPATSKKVESDTYAFMNPGPQPRDPIPQGGRGRSGQVLAQGRGGEIPLHSSFPPGAGIAGGNGFGGGYR